MPKVTMVKTSSQEEAQFAVLCDFAHLLLVPARSDHAEEERQRSLVVCRLPRLEVGLKRKACVEKDWGDDAAQCHLRTLNQGRPLHLLCLMPVLLCLIPLLMVDRESPEHPVDAWL